MSCKHCLWQVPLETKADFPYLTEIVGNMLVVSKKKRFPFLSRSLSKYKWLYANEIKKCPVCGDDLLDMGNELFSADCVHALKQMLIERFGEDAINEKIKNYKEID